MSKPPKKKQNTKQNSCHSSYFVKEITTDTGADVSLTVNMPKGCSIPLSLHTQLLNCLDDIQTEVNSAIKEIRKTEYVENWKKDLKEIFKGRAIYITMPESSRTARGTAYFRITTTKGHFKVYWDSLNLTIDWSETDINKTCQEIFPGTVNNIPSIPSANKYAIKTNENDDIIEQSKQLIKDIMEA